MANIIDVLGIVFFPIPAIIFLIVLRSNFKNLSKNNALLTIFSVRSASLLPIFSFTVFVSLLKPEIFPAMRVPQSIFEAYAVYCFVALLVVNCGGAEKAARMIQDSDIPLICYRYKKEAPSNSYQRILNSIRQFLYIRPIIELIAAICAYKGATTIYSIAIYAAALSTVYMIPGLLTVARVLYDECEGLNVAYKFIVIKVSVGLILIEDAVQQYLYSSGTVSISDDIGNSDYSEEEKFIRIYSMIAIIECALLSVFLYIGFVPALVPAKSCIVIEENEESESQSNHAQEANNILDLKWTFNEYIVNLFSIFKWTCAMFLTNDSAKSDANEGTIKEALIAS